VNKNNGKNEPKQKPKPNVTEKPSIDHMRMGHRETQAMIGDAGDD